MSSTTKNWTAGRLPYLLLSLLLLAPCYWQPRVQGGDLSSHIDRAWLTQWIEGGGAEGLQVVNRTTNVLFDLMLSGLFQIFNPEFAQRIAVSIAVLIFAWGAFAFVRVVAGRRPWHLFSCIAMFAYGWVFQMGFFNFYLSLGLCFWVLSLMWEPTPRRIAAAVPLAALAYLAHALPFIWMAGLAIYLWMVRRMSHRIRADVTAASLLFMVILHLWLDRTSIRIWSPGDSGVTPGSDQAWLFDGKYYLLMAGLLIAWGVMFLQLLRSTGARRLASSLSFQICILSAMGVVLLPSTMLIPGLNHALVYIAERMSLGVAICVCAFLGPVQPRPQVRYGLVLMAILFFGFLYGDERKRNAYEDQRQDTVAQIVLTGAPALNR